MTFLLIALGVLSASGTGYYLYNNIRKKNQATTLEIKIGQIQNKV